MSEPIQLIVGLGNPGDKYALTRHNAGFWLVDAVARHYAGVWRFENRFSAEIAQILVEGREVRLVKPQTFMNRSGDAVAAVLRYFRLEPAQMLVAHDELDILPGTVRLKNGGGHGGHNGLRDIHRVVGGDFWRVRIGIGHPGHKSQVVGYVLKRADPTSEAEIQGALDATLAEIPAMLAGEMQPVMNRLHAG